MPPNGIVPPSGPDAAAQFDPPLRGFTEIACQYTAANSKAKQAAHGNATKHPDDALAFTGEKIGKGRGVAFGGCKDNLLPPGFGAAAIAAV